MTQIALTSPAAVTILLERGKIFTATPGISSHVTVAVPAESVAATVSAATDFGPYPADREVTLNLILGAVVYEVKDSAGGGAVSAGSIVTALDDATPAELAQIQSSVSGAVFFDMSSYGRSSGKTRSSRYEQPVAIPVGTVTEIFSASGAGVVTEIFIVGSSVAFARDWVTKVYIDGESTPSIEMEHHAFGTFMQDANAGPFSHQRIYIGKLTASTQKIRFAYPIPFGSSCRITITAVGAQSQLWTTVAWQQGVIVPWRLKTSSVKYAGRQTYTPTQQGNRTIRFLETPAGTPTIIAGLYIGGEFASGGYTWMENNVVVYDRSQALDGSVEPMFNTSGFEDFFKASFYFDDGVTSYTNSFCAARSLTAWSGVIDLIGAVGGISSDNGVVLTMERGTAANPGDSSHNVTLNWCVFYYVPA